MSPGHAASARLFIALWPDDAVRTALAARRDAFAWPAGTRPTPDDKLHATLHFIGAVPRHRVDEIKAGLALAVEAPAAFELQLDRTVVWPNGLAVLLASELPPALHDLHGKLAVALRGLALAVESRALRPHVTLARRAGGRAALPSFDPVRWVVDGYALVESVPDGGTTRYGLLHRYPCG